MVIKKKPSDSNKNKRSIVKTKNNYTENVGSTGTVDNIDDFCDSESLLNLKFPRCCVCSTDWFLPSSPTQKKRSWNWREQRCRELLPLPNCQCKTRLACDEEDSCDGPFLKRKEGNNTFLKKVKFLSFSNLAMCRSCLEKTIDVSSEVLEHDYRDVNQPNIKFTVEPKCVQCQVKFTKRKLNNLLSWFDSSGCSKSQSIMAMKSNVDRLKWLKGILHTIEVVDATKSYRYHHRDNVYKIPCRDEQASQEQKEYKISNINVTQQSANDTRKKNSDKDTKNDCLKQNQNRSFVTCCSKNKNKAAIQIENNAASRINQSLIFEDGATSDECFSDYEGTSSSKISISSCSKVARSQTLNEGELIEELCRKDPKFRQELDDKRLIEEKMKTLDGRRELGLVSEEKEGIERHKSESKSKMIHILEDEQLARKLQKEFDQSLQKQLRPNRANYMRSSSSFKRKRIKSSNISSMIKKKAKEDLTLKPLKNEYISKYLRTKANMAEAQNDNDVESDYGEKIKIRKSPSDRTNINTMLNIQENRKCVVENKQRILRRSYTSSVVSEEEQIMSKRDEEFARELQKKFDEEIYKTIDRKQLNTKRKHSYFSTKNQNTQRNKESVTGNEARKIIDDDIRSNNEVQDEQDSCIEHDAPEYKLTGRKNKNKDIANNTIVLSEASHLRTGKEVDLVISDSVVCNAQPKCKTNSESNSERHFTSIQEKWDQIWESHYFELVEFKKKYGHCIVPKVFPENPSLGIWVSSQRVKYKRKLKPGSRVSFPKERIDKLETLGFIWSLKSKGETKPYTLTESKDIKQPHENVKKNINENCRENFKEKILRSDETPIKRKNIHPSLTESFDVAEELDITSNGLNLISEKCRTKEVLETQMKDKCKNSHDTDTIDCNKWDLCYKKLIQFKEKFGHVCVSKRSEEFSELAIWVLLERTKFLQSNNGGDPYPLERFEKLNELGFVWKWSREIMDKCHAIEEEKLKANQEQILDDQSDNTYEVGENLIGTEGTYESIETSTTKREYTRTDKSKTDHKPDDDNGAVIISSCDSTSHCKYECIISKEKLKNLSSLASTSPQLFPKDGKSTNANDGIANFVSNVKTSKDHPTLSKTFQFLCSSSEEDSNSSSCKNSPKRLEMYHEETNTSTEIAMSRMADLSDRNMTLEAIVSTSYSNMPVEEKSSDNGVSPPILQRMISMGFDVSEARQALQDANNDLRLAISMIFSEKLSQD